MDSGLARCQQRELRGHARLGWWHWVIVASSVVVTGIAWQFSHSLLEEQAVQRFEREASDVVRLIEERLGHYEDALLAGVASIQSRDGEVTREQWRRYATKLRLPERYPGIGGIGVIKHVDSTGVGAFVERMRVEHGGYELHPQHPFESHLPIAYIEPEEQNAAAIGLDVAFETNRRTAALRALRLGSTQISGSIELIQDTARTPGFLIYAPYYRDTAVRDRRRQDAFATTDAFFSGFVYAPLVVKDLIAGVLGPDNPRVALTLRDDGKVLYDDADGSPSIDVAFAIERHVSVYGRTWSFAIAPTADFGMLSASRQPLMVLIFGLLIDTMLFALFWLMARSNRKVQILANDLLVRTDDLSVANDKLASFAHVASHDLKSPLRNVHDLVEFLEEDLEDYLGSVSTNPEVRVSLDALRRQANKGTALVEGILQYSSADAARETQQLVDSRAVVEEICRSTGLVHEHLELDGEFPVFHTFAVRFGQVLQNLIGNAVKFHDDAGNARLRIGVTHDAGFYRFEIEDDGPGIDPRFQQRIFEPFYSLNSRPEVDSSGIGLSIVQRSVESVGGSVSVSSELGHGSTFRFDWPDSIYSESRAAA